MFAASRHPFEVHQPFAPVSLNMKKPITSFVLAAALFGSSTTFAQSLPGNKPLVNFSGFATLAVGRIVGGSHDEAADLGYDCPCFISDYAQSGVYERRRAQFGPDSKLGVQGQISSPDQRYSITGQLVSRGAANGRINLEWLYLTAELNSRLTLQAGRKRLPLFNYSDVQDVGHALPWIHLPPQLYGWEVVNYNGANLRYREQLGSWTVNANTFAGAETATDSGFWKIYNGKTSRTASKWTNIVGAELKGGKGWFELRGLYMQSNTQNRIANVDDGYSDPQKQRIYGLSATADFGGPFASVELLSIDRKADYGGDKAQLYSAGYRLGKFTPLLSYASYRQTLNDSTAVPEGHDTFSAVLRYDLTSSSALKVQFDVWKDKSGSGFGSQHGDSRLLTLSYDTVF
jgi:Gram-negative porin